jgi:hypothetical protein
VIVRRTDFDFSLYKIMIMDDSEATEHGMIAGKLNKPLFRVSTGISAGVSTL